MITLTTFRWVPPLAQGLVRDMRVRWALEEAGLPYTTRLIDLDERGSADHRARQPFGQVPVLEEDGLTLFESGAILLYLAERSDTVEVAIMPLAELDLFHGDKEWAAEVRPHREAHVRKRLEELAAWIGPRAYLEDRFTVADLMMATVLQILRHTELVAEQPVLAAYKARLRDHMAVFGKETTATAESV